MARKEKEYKRLPGQSRTAFAVSGVSRSSMWLARDHLLYVENEGYSEDYRRFYFKDIQAILVRQTVAGAVGTSILTVITALMTLWLTHAVSQEWDRAGIIALGIVTLFFLVPLIINVLRGPTCATYVRTAVQTERIQSICRLRTALKIIGRLRSAIEEAQGGAFTEELVERMTEEIARVEEENARKSEEAKAAQLAGQQTRNVKPYRGRIHQLLFGLLLADFCHNCLQFHFSDPNMYFVALALGLGILAAAVVALVKQFGTDLWTGIKALTWAVVPYLILLNVVTNISFYVFSLPHLAAQPHSWHIYRAMYATSPFDSWFRMVLVALGIIGSGGLGLSGLLMLNSFQRSRATVEQDVPA